MAEKEVPSVQACLFDMDGLLINTEDLYSESTNIVLREYGKPPMPWSIKAQLQGRPGPEAVEILQAWAQLPIDYTTFNQKQAALHATLFPTSVPLPGATSLLQRLRQAGIPLALATSSQHKNYVLKTTHLSDLFSAFPPAQIVLGDDNRIPKGRGKPAPDIYLLALDTINQERRLCGQSEIRPAECLVFEDSVPGVEAGRRAGMQVIWCPHPMLLQEFRGRETEVLAGQSRDDSVHDRKIASRWAKLVTSLEEVDLREYGINLNASTSVV